jgi:hypothetical protein
MEKLILPLLEYNLQDKGNFEIQQIEKLFEEITEFRIEQDYIKKANELIDIIQVSLSLLNLYNNDILDMACKNNYEKHENRNIHAILGKIEILINKQ